jgi:glyoxylase-like metal-dependent hydrolase (beta-lactamase superfamily II)
MSRLELATIPVTPFQQNCTLLWDPETLRGVIVDPGGEADRIIKSVQRLGLRIESILLTHGHLDHAGAAAEVKEALEKPATAGDTALLVPILGPDERDRFLLEHIEEQAAHFGLTGMRNVLPDRWLQDGDTVDIAGNAFEVQHCPGHTPGHLVFASRALRFALIGDVLFRGSVGRTDFPYGDHAALLRSIRDKLMPLGDDVTFACGHGPGSTLGEERRSNPFLAGTSGA